MITAYRTAARRRHVRQRSAAAPITDAFNRANSATTLGTTDTGQAWTVVAGTWGIDTNQAYRAAGTGLGMAVVQGGRSDGVVQTTFAVAAGAPILAARQTDINNYVGVLAETTQYTLFKQAAGSFITIGSWPGVPTAGDVVRLDLSGASLTVRINGTVRITVTDAFNQTATKFGLAVSGSTTPRFDTFSLT